MESITLHTMARRYLMSRNGKLHADAAELPNDGRFLCGYTRAAKRIYPRYHVVDAMLVEIERLDPDSLPPLDQLAAALSGAATTARSRFTTRLGRTEAKVTAEERELFRESIQSWLDAEELAVEPLPYRRVLGDEEAHGWRDRLAHRWGLDHDRWHPLITAAVPEDVLVVDSAALAEGGAGLVRTALADLGLRRVVEIREEGDPSSVLDLDAVEPAYTGAEGFWTDDTLAWVVYSSHVGSVAFGGTLAERLRTSWPDQPAK